MNILFASLFIVTFTQVTNAQTIDELTLEYEPLIEERHRTLGVNMGLIASQMRQTRGALRMNISIASSEAKKDLIQLRNFVSLEVAQAEAENRNIEACVVALNDTLLQLNLGEIYACRAQTQMQIAGLKWIQLAWAQRDLATVLPTCLIPSQSDITLSRSCIDGELARIDNQITAIIADLNSLIDVTTSVGKECVDTRRNQIQNQISVAANDFRTCTGTK